MVLKAKSVESRWILDYLWLYPPESRPIKEIEFVTTSPVLKPDKIFGIPIFVAAAGVDRLPILIWKLRRSTISFFILPLPARPDLPTYFYGTLEKQKKNVKSKRRNQTPRNFLRQAEEEEGCEQLSKQFELIILLYVLPHSTGNHCKKCVSL